MSGGLPPQRAPQGAVIPRQATRADHAGPSTPTAEVTAAGAVAATAPHPVSEAAAAVGAAAERLSGDQPFSSWLRTWGVHVEAMLVFTAGVAAAFAGSNQPYVALAVLAIWMLRNYHHGRAVTTPLTGQLKTAASSAMLPMALLALGVGFAHVPPAMVPHAFAAVAAAATTSVACRTLRWRLQAPIRVVVVGDRAAVAMSTTQWARTNRVRVVGGLVVEPGLAADAVPQEIFGVPTVEGLGAVKTLVRHWQADLVVVNPGGGVSADDFRRLSWALEGSAVSIGVSGVLDAVAPHRITAGGLGRSAILDVRPPRQSTFVRGVKSAFDRGIGLILLVLVSPVLAAMVVAVKLDSKGPAFFAQVRVGRAGRQFKVYKMRTMIQDAESIKARLSEANEVDSVLFKIRRDPRVTRVGSFLRKSSLDELPQLLNVVRGEMSLVGPRPFVPEEVARMDADALRRHVVQPGITGMWQVSGRSDLAWNEAAAMDTYYADNWTLSGDLAIAVRTVKAVLAGRGAY